MPKKASTRTFTPVRRLDGLQIRLPSQVSADLLSALVAGKHDAGAIVGELLATTLEDRILPGLRYATVRRVDGEVQVGPWSREVVHLLSEAWDGGPIYWNRAPDADQLAMEAIGAVQPVTVPHDDLVACTFYGDVECVVMAVREEPVVELADGTYISLETLHERPQRYRLA